MPRRLGEIAQVLKAFGITVESPGRGRHWKLVRGAQRYPVKAHNGLRSEISVVYIRAIKRRFNLPDDAL